MQSFLLPTLLVTSGESSLEHWRKWIMPLTPEDVLILGLMKQHGVLLPVEPHLLDQKEGIIFVGCGDADCSPDMVQQQSSYVTAHRETARVHLITMNGGALLVPAISPLNRELHEDLVILRHVQAARDMKGIHVVALYAHRPCGAATAAGLSLEQTIELLVEGKARMVSTLKVVPQLKVACFLHLLHPDGKKRTWFVSREAWRIWKSQPGKFGAASRSSPTA